MIEVECDTLHDAVFRRSPNDGPETLVGCRKIHQELHRHSCALLLPDRDAPIDQGNECNQEPRECDVVILRDDLFAGCEICPKNKGDGRHDYLWLIRLLMICRPAKVDWCRH